MPECANCGGVGCDSCEEYEITTTMRPHEALSGHHLKIKNAKSRTPREARAAKQKRRNRARMKAQKKSRRKNRG